MDSPTRLLRQIKRHVQSVTYSSPFYRLMLDQGEVPDKMRLSLPDPWPGDSARGQALIAGHPELFDSEALSCDLVNRCFLTHECLRDLRAVGTEIARRRAIALIHEWIEDSAEQWDEISWSPAVLGARLAHWIAFYDFYSPAATHDFTGQIMSAAVRQLRHLENTTQASLFGLEATQAIKGLVYGGLALTDSEKAVGLALDLLLRQIETEILPDGGHISRNPSVLADMLRLFIDIRGALCAARIDIPHDLSLAITRMMPAVRFFRHGDGGLALFNGSETGRTLTFEATQTLSGAKARSIKQLSQMGYERLTAGRSLLLVDAGGPPPRPHDGQAHAGLMSFEFSVGKERLFTNCGAAPQTHNQWSRAMAATAAHNTIVLQDTNACELLPDGGIGQRPHHIQNNRYEVNNTQFVDMVHDGYWPRHKVKLQRLISLGQEGDELRCKESLFGPAGRSFAIRWHLHPDVKALLAQDEGSALLRTPSGTGWRLRLTGAGRLFLTLEPSIYCGEGQPRGTLQLCLSGKIGPQGGRVEWSLTRETTRKVS